MAVSNKKAMFSSDIHTVWSIMTDVERCAWRSDLSKTEVLNEKTVCGVHQRNGGWPARPPSCSCYPGQRSRS